MLGGATEVEAQAAAFGGDEAECCAADTKGTKDHEGTRRQTGEPPITPIGADYGPATAG